MGGHVEKVEEQGTLSRQNTCAGARPNHCSCPSLVLTSGLLLDFPLVESPLDSLLALLLGSPHSVIHQTELIESWVRLGVSSMCSCDVSSPPAFLDRAPLSGPFYLYLSVHGPESMVGECLEKEALISPWI